MRSCNWKGIEELKDLNTVISFILPEVIKVTGLNWSIANNMLHSQVVNMILDRETLAKNGDRNLAIDNEVIRNLYSRFPTLSDDDIGYQLNCSNQLSCSNYKGFWAIDANSIIERGAIASRKYGL